MPATGNIPLVMETGDRNEVPAAAENFYLGQMVFDDGNGNASGTLGTLFLGHVADPLDNSGGSAGGANVRLIGDAHYRMKVPISGVTKADKGKQVYASDNNTYALTKTNNTLVGYVYRVDAAGEAIVMFTPVGPAIVPGA